MGPGAAEPGRAPADVRELFNGKVDEEENGDSLILEPSDSLLFIVL